jgi:membrane peptidoglycan carboxypeptidase
MGTVARLVVAAVGAGLLLGAVLVPLVGTAGIAVRNAANTFNNLSVPSLGQIPSRSTILDANGNVIAYYYPGGIFRDPVTYDQIAPVMRNAIVAIEDNRFWLHGAFDLRGTIRAFVNDASGNPTQGGSTLAQQYVKNALVLTASTKSGQAAAIEDTSSRKIRELKIAANVEHEMTKQQLLAAYLNVAFFNNNAYGIQVAAERYFSVSAADLNLQQSAMLAGLVENPDAFNPLTDPTDATTRRNTVLAAMAASDYITTAQANAAAKEPLGLNPSQTPLEEGCTASSAANEAYFCDYVLAALRTDKAYAKAYQQLTSTGGLTIYTTLDPQDQQSAQNAVTWVAPAGNGFYNPGNNVDAEVLIQPGTGDVRAIAVNRPYGTGSGQNSVDYAVNSQYDGGSGVQTGSSSKLFTLVTALKQGVPFGYSQTVTSPETVTGYTDCQGNPAGTFAVNNAEGNTTKPEAFTLYNGTTQSINVFYAHLEQKVGLCDVVQTAASMGLTYANGVSLLKADPALGQGVSADNIPSFTLGAVPVSPMGMAAAYATVASNGIYCSPVAITKITSSAGVSLPVLGAGCHRVLSTDVADAANYILQGVLTASNATADGRGINVPAAAKTGTANGGFYAAFAGYTPRLVGYVSVFNPTNPTQSGAMINQNACYREDPAFGGDLDCPGQMFGDNAPAATWQMTFDHADLGSPAAVFDGVSTDSPFLSEGNGVNSPPVKQPGQPGQPGQPTQPPGDPNPVPTIPDPFPTKPKR